MNAKVAKIGKTLKAPSGHKGDFCDPFNGDFNTTVPVFSVAGRGITPSLALTYDSLAAQSETTAGMFGFGWSSAWDASAQIVTSGTECQVTITQANGSQVAFSAPSACGTSGLVFMAVTPGSFTSGGAGSPDTFVTATLSYESSFPATSTAGIPAGSLKNVYVLSLHGGLDELLFSSSAGMLVAEADASGYVTTVDTCTKPGTGACPSEVTLPSIASCTVIDDTASDQTLTLALDASGQAIEAIDPMGRTAAFSYDSDHQLTGITNPSSGSVSSGAGGATTITYGRWNLLATITSPAGDVTTNTYGSTPLTTAGEWSYYPVIAQSDPMGRTSLFCYYLPSSSTSFTGYGGNISAADLPSGAGQPCPPAAKVSVPDRSSFTYPLPYLATDVVDPNGTQTLYDYRSDGNLLQSVTTGYATPEAATWQYHYNVCPGIGNATSSLVNGLPCEIIGPRGDATGFAYGPGGNITSYTNADAETTTYTYNSFGEVTSVVPPTGPGTANTYDGGGQLTASSTCPFGSLSEVSTGFTCAVLPSQSLTTEYDYGDPAFPGDVTSLVEPSGEVWHYLYDTEGNVAAVIDPEGNETTYSYNPDGQVTSSTTPRGNPAVYAGNLTGIAIGPSGSHAYVANLTSGTVEPIDLATGVPGTPIPLAISTGSANPDPAMIAVADVPGVGETAYVSDNGAGKVTPINLATDTPVSSVTVGANPIGIATASDGVGFVANFEAGTVSAIDLADDRVVSTIPVGSGPVDVAVGANPRDAAAGQVAWVTNYESESLTPIDVSAAASGFPSAGTPISFAAENFHPRMIVVSPSGDTAYLTGEMTEGATSEGELAKVDLQTGAFQGLMTALPNPMGLALDSSNGELYVADFGSDTEIVPVDTATNTPEAPISTSPTPTVPSPPPATTCSSDSSSASGACLPLPTITPTPPAGCPALASGGQGKHGGRGDSHVVVLRVAHGHGKGSRESKGSKGAEEVAYVADRSGDAIVPVDLATCVTGVPIYLGVQPDALVASRGGRILYAVSFEAGELFAIDTTTDTVTNSIYLGVENVALQSPIPGSIALAPDQRTLYVTGGLGSSDILAVDLTTGKVARHIAVGPAPTGIAISGNGRYAFVTSFSGGTLTPVNLRTGKVGAGLLVGSGPVAVTLSPSGRIAYVADDRAGSVVPVAINEPAKRGAAPVLGIGTPLGVGAGPVALAGRHGDVLVSVQGASALLTLAPLSRRTWSAPASCASASGLAELWCAELQNLANLLNAQCSTPPPASDPAAQFTCAILAGWGELVGLNTATSYALKAVSSVAIQSPFALALATGGHYAYVSSYATGSLVPVGLAAAKSGPAIPVGPEPAAVAVVRVAPPACGVRSARDDTYEPSSCGHRPVKDPPGPFTTTYTYDALGNLVSTTTPATPAAPAGATTSYTYTPDSQVASVTDPMGKVTSYAYDADGETTSVTSGANSASASTTTYTYDAEGNVETSATGVTSTSTGEVTSYAYADAAYPHLATARTNPDGETTTNFYDAAGELVSSSDPMGQVTSYAYDPAGRLTDVLEPASAPSYTLYVTNAGSGTASSGSTGTVATLNTATEALGQSIDVGSNPTDVIVSPDGTRAYVANHGLGGANTVSVIDTLTNQVTKTITGLPPGPEGVAMAISPSGSYLYVTSSGPPPGSPPGTASGTLSVVSLADDQLVATIPVGINPTYVALSPDGATAYVTNSGSDTLSVVDTVTSQVTGSITVGQNPAIVAFGPKGAHAYVTDLEASSANGALSVIDTATDKVSSTIPLGHLPLGLAIGPNGTHAYVTDPGSCSATPGSCSLSVVDLASEKVTTVSSGSFDGPAEVALAPLPSITYSYDSLGRVQTMTDATGTTTYAYTPLGQLASVTDGAGNTVSYAYVPGEVDPSSVDFERWSSASGAAVRQA